MELINPNESNHIAFRGKGSELFGIVLFNWILMSLTLGLYYPWARVLRLKFLFQHTQLNGTPFLFHGTGTELFKGFIKVFLFLALFYGLFFYALLNNDQTLLVFTWFSFFIVLAFIIPLAIHGALRYRLSRTSWRGIHMGYRGDRSQLLMGFIFGYLGVIFSFGIYYSWFVNKLRTYCIGNIRFGNLRFGYDGNGTELFIINLKGIFLSYLTLGIYYFWYRKEWMNYYADHTYIIQGENRYYLKGHVKGGSFFGLMIVNFFLTVFTLGLGIPWVIVRTFTFIIHHIELPAGVNFDAIAQTEDEYKDAAGDDMIDALDLGIV